MKTIISLIFIMFAPVASLAINLQAICNVTIIVVGEDNKPIKNASVNISFETKNPGKVVQKNGYSDSFGIFSASEQAFLGKIYYGVEKEGYYKSTGKHEYLDKSVGVWKSPDEEFTVVLRKIENPVPMYARNTRYMKLEIPKIGEMVGFDLIEFDWVSPYGRGVNKDIFFILEKEYISDDNYNGCLNIYFPNKFDGIQAVKENLKYGSEFKLPRFAPESGYQKELKLRVSRSPGEWVKLSSQDDDNYIFRIRSEDKNGTFFRGIYGKILGPIEFFQHSSATAIISFKYYLNPDYTRNLEFDPKRNLFGKLPSLEMVKEP